MNEYKIVSACSHLPKENYYCLQSYVKSLGNEDAIILTENFGKWGGLGTKPRWLYKAITENIIDTKYMIFSDCWDFIFAAPPRDLFNAYISMQIPIVISAEKNCFPENLKDEYDKFNPPTSYKYLNSGLIVGETEAILTCLESMDAKNIPDDYWDGEKMVNPNDQFFWQREFIKQPVHMILDYHQQLCNTLHQVEIDELEFDNGFIKNKETNTYPCSFHFNGGAKTNGLREPILEHLKLL